jgi:hypothetical protein
MKNIVCIVICWLSIASYGQFSDDPTTFLKDVDKYLSGADRVKTKAFMEVFEPNWLTNFSPQYQQKVVATANLIYNKRLPPFPELYGYLLSVHSFVENKQSEESFDSWHQTIDQLLNSKKVKKFRDFIEICANFFTDGTIYYSTNHIWKISGGTYLFEFEKNSPNIVFKDADLQCYIVNRQAGKNDNPYFDSTIVRKTNGLFEPLIDKWTGRGGTLDWQKVGLDKATNYAEITDYLMSLKSTKVESDSALVYTDYYETPLYGTFSDMAKKINREVDRVYPQFVSFSKEILRKSIVPEVDYVGGFAIEGADFKGVGYDNKLASLVFYKEGKPFVKAQAMRFKINPSKVQAQECQVTLYLSDEDTLFHPGLNITYDLQKLEMARSDDGIAQAPFKDSYHHIDMYVDRVVWTKGDVNLNLTWHPLSSQKYAKFESQDYFNLDVYNKIQGLNQVNPLVAIYQYSYKYDLQVMPIGKVSGAMGYTNEQALPIILDLANQGFLNYNKSQQTITLQPKMKKYIDARAGRTDYDNLVFAANLLEVKKQPLRNPDGSANKSAESYNVLVDSLNRRKSSRENFGNINLNTLDLSLKEIDPIEVSPSQNVVIFPNEGALLLKEDLNFLFEGAIMSGKTEFYVKDAAFNYEDFKIDLVDVDVALLRVKPIFGGTNKPVPMRSHFSGLKGTLYIDHASNRSGKNTKDFGKFPYLKTTEDSYVYYNHQSVYNGVYDSANFYFKVDPFTFDSLDTYDELSVSFAGEMRSAGIFPIFKEELKIQADYSFGFVTQAPETGYDFYGQDAKFDNEIRLSNEGLRGAGEIDFITSNSKSENFIFFPDSTMGIAQYVNKPQTADQGLSVPDVSGDQVVVTYVPKQKVLKARSTKNALVMYNKEAELFGVTELRAEGMTGKGLVYFKDAELGSAGFDFKRWTIDSDTADFNLLTANPDADLAEGEKNPLSFDSRNLTAHVDFSKEARRGEFKSNDGTSIVKFPKNDYICFVDMFTWLMDKDEMELSQDETAGTSDVTIESDLNLAKSNFFSTHPDQDSLNFKAPKAKFFVKDNIIACEKVEFVDVADARIYPPEQKLTIRKKAKMDPFENAEIVANFITKYHTIKEANVQILARRSYEASGTYPYIDSKENIQNIFFENIGLDSAYQTVAVGKVEKDKNFSLSDKFDFYGTVELYAADQFLTFDGATRINHECNQFDRNWLQFRSDIDPNNIQIPVSDNVTDLEGNGIAIGLVKRTTNSIDSLEVYPAFLSALDNPDDLSYLHQTGY